MASFTAKHKGMSIEANGRLRRSVKHEIETVKAQKRNKIQYKPELPDATDEDDDENSLGYNEYLLGKHANRGASKRSVQANETPAKRVITRSVSKGRHARTPLGDITPLRVFESSLSINRMRGVELSSGTDCSSGGSQYMRCSRLA
eukprot:scaffold42224_cov343-Skeletonema_marinoi.AAC.1